MLPLPKTFIAIAVLAGLVMISGCSSTPKHSHSASKSSALFPKSTQKTHTQKRLANHFRSWKRTPYRLGGNNKKGIDCSGFVHITYRDVFAREVPRTTRQLAKLGRDISPKSLKFGDLVFFKTSRRVRHVGIYIGQGNFIHASTSRGVMRSNLGSSYWQKRFWKAKRLLS